MINPRTIPTTPKGTTMATHPLSPSEAVDPYHGLRSLSRDERDAADLARSKAAAASVERVARALVAAPHAVGSRSNIGRLESIRRDPNLSPALRTAVEAVIATERAKPAPEHVETYRPPFRVNARRHSAASVVVGGHNPNGGRKLDPEEVALLTLLGAKRDDLTEAEAITVAKLRDDADSKGRALAEHVLAPSAARVAQAVAASELNTARQELSRLPAKPPALAPQVLDVLRTEMASVLASTMPGVSEQDALGVAAARLAEARADAEGEYLARREQVESTIAELSTTLGAASAHPATLPGSGPTLAPVVSLPIPPTPPTPARSYTLPNGQVIDQATFDRLAALADSAGTGGDAA